MDTPASSFEEAVQRNVRYNSIVLILNGAFWVYSASFVARETILPLYVSHFTDSKLLIGLLAAISSAGWFVPQLFTVNWTRRLPRRLYAPVRVGLFTERLPLILLAPAAWLFASSPTLSLIAFYLLFAWHVLGNGVVGVGFQEVQATVLPIGRRGRVMGTTQLAGTLGGALCAMVAGQILTRYELPLGYVLCFATAGLLTLVSWFWLSLVREPVHPPDARAPNGQNMLRSLLSLLRSDGNFRGYLLGRFTVSIGSMAVGFLMVYATERWELAGAWAGSFTIGMLVGQALGFVLSGTAGDRFGHKPVLELGGLSIALAVGLALVAPSPAWFLAVFGLVGIGTAGIKLAGTMIAFEFSSPDDRPAYIGLNNTVAGIGVGTAAIIGGGLADIAGYGPLMLVALTAGLLGICLLHSRVRDPRSLAEAAQP